MARNADNIEVTLIDGRELSAELVGLDEVDLAVLKLESAEDLTQIHIADSAGGWVISWSPSTLASARR